MHQLFLRVQCNATNALQLRDPSTASDFGNLAYLHSRSKNSNLFIVPSNGFHVGDCNMELSGYCEVHLHFCNANKLTRTKKTSCILHMNPAVRGAFLSDPLDGYVRFHAQSRGL